MVPDQSETRISSSKLPDRLGWINLTLGGGSPLEMWVASSSHPFLQAICQYFLPVDIALAVLAIVSGCAILQRTKWAAFATCIAGSAIFLNASGWLVKFGPSVYLGLQGRGNLFIRLNPGPGDLGIVIGIGSRLLFNALQIGYWLLAVGMVLHEERSATSGLSPHSRT